VSGKGIARLVFLIILSICAIIAFGSGLVISKKKYKNNEMERNRKLMRLRAICFVIMLVMLLLIIVIK